MLKICLLTYFNQYESKRYFMARLKEALERLGIQTLLIDPKKGIISSEIRKSIQAFGPDFMFSFNSTISDEKGKFLWDYLEVPCLTALVDPAFYSLEMTKSPLSRFCSVDREDVQWLNTNGVKNTFFWPHAVEADLTLSPREKIYDIVFLGTCTDYEGLKKKSIQALKADEVTILNQAIEAMFGPSSPSLIQAVSSSFSSLSGLDPKEIDFRSIFHYLDNYVRGRDRVELIRALAPHQVHVFGEPAWNNPSQEAGGWSSYFKDSQHVILHPPVSYAESFQVINQAKIALNSVPFFKHGSHERIFNAFMAGAVPLTTQNGFIDEFFVAGEDLLIYRVNQWEQAKPLVESLLLNEQKRRSMAQAGRKKILADHTWDIRAKTLLENYKIQL